MSKVQAETWKKDWNTGKIICSGNSSNQSFLTLKLLQFTKITCSSWAKSIGASFIHAPMISLVHDCIVK